MLSGSILATCLPAQDLPTGVNRAEIFIPIRDYLPPTVAPIRLANSPRLDTLIRAGNLYINVHSETNPNGFARGQLLLDPGSAIKQALHDLQTLYNAKDVAGLVARVTDRGLQESFEEPDRATALQDLPNFIGEPPITITPVSEVQVEGGRASVNVILSMKRSTKAMRSFAGSVSSV